MKNEILLVIERLAKIGAESPCNASVMCNAIEMLMQFVEAIEEKEEENLDNRK